MNTETKNRPVRKAAMVIGLVAVLVLIAWLSITIVKNVPGSFASLASLAESVRSFDAQRMDNASDDEASLTTNGVKDMLVVTSDTNVIENGNDVRLSWTDASTQGSFVFSYECTDGVAISIVEENGVRNIDCDTNYNLGNVNNTTLNVTSERDRFVDVDYSLGFIAKDATEPGATSDAVITVVNEDVPIMFAANTEVEETETIPEEVVEETPEEVVTETPAEETVEKPVAETPTPVAPVEEPAEEFVQEFTYTIPVSDPNGRIDLATRFLDTGSIVNDTFISGPLYVSDISAIQFEVKNLGTKTSEDWTYSVSLPNGSVVDSPAQTPLKPNERAVITIGFPSLESGSYGIDVQIETEDDNTSINNRFIEVITS